MNPLPISYWMKILLLKTVTLSCLAILVACSISCKEKPAAVAKADSSPPGLAVSDGRFLLAGRPYRGVGVNYYDLFTRLAAKPTDESSLAGLAMLGRAGVPFVRFNAGAFSAKEWERSLRDPAAHFVAMDRVVRAAEQAGVGLIPSFFWTKHLATASGERMSDWGRTDSRTLATMRDYTTALVTRYRSSRAVWAWEFGNEWNLSADLPNAADFRPKGGDERDDLKSGQLDVALSEFAATVRALDPRRPLLTGHSHPRFATWHNTNKRSWEADSFEQWREILHRENPRDYNTVGIHIYADTDAHEAGGRWATDWLDYLEKLKAFADETKRPLFVGEFGLAEGGKFSPSEVKTRYREIISAIEASRVDLAAVWVFDLPNQEGTWNVSFTNARAYMLDDAVQANRRLQMR